MRSRCFCLSYVFSLSISDSTLHLDLFFLFAIAFVSLFFLIPSGPLLRCHHPRLPSIGTQRYSNLEGVRLEVVRLNLSLFSIRPFLLRLPVHVQSCDCHASSSHHAVRVVWFPGSHLPPLSACFRCPGLQPLARASDDEGITSSPFLSRLLRERAAARVLFRRPPLAS